MRIVLTGGPGTGKSFLLSALAHEGYHVFEDAATSLIISGEQPPMRTNNPTSTFPELVLKQRMVDFLSGSVNQVCFYDRGLPDGLGFSYYMNKAAPADLLKAIEQYRYDHVIVLPSWPEIYTKNEYRLESFREASQIHMAILKAYSDCGYNLTELQKGSVEDRIRLIREVISQAM